MREIICPRRWAMRHTAPPDADQSKVGGAVVFLDNFVD